MSEFAHLSEDDGAALWGDGGDVSGIIVNFGGPNAIEVYGDDGHPLVTVGRDGALTYGEGYEPDDAARRFWEALADVDIIRRAFDR